VSASDPVAPTHSPPIEPAFRAVLLVALDVLFALLLIEIATAHHSTAFDRVVVPVTAGLAILLIVAHVRVCILAGGGRPLARLALAALSLLLGALVMSYVPSTRAAMLLGAIAVLAAAARLCPPTRGGARALLVLASTLTTLQAEELVLGVLGRGERAASRSATPIDWGDLLTPLVEMRRGGRLRPGFDQLARGPDPRGGVRTITNCDGFRNTSEFAEQPPPGTTRVLLIGDSFTGGYRTAQCDLWSELVSRSLDATMRASGCSVELPTAVVNDPSEAWYYYARFAATVRPHVVALAITVGNDLTQSYLNLGRGGALRYVPDDAGSITLATNPDVVAAYAALDSMYLPAHAWQPQSWGAWLRKRMYNLSRTLRSGRVGAALGDCAVALGWPPAGDAINCWYTDDVPRAMDLMQGLGFFLGEAPPVIEEAYALARLAVVRLHELCTRDGVTLAVLVFPQRFQVHPRDWQAMVARYGLVSESFDLDRPNRFVRDLARELELPCCDVTPVLQRSAEAEHTALYLPQGDMHWNVQGHRTVAGAVEPFLRKLLERRR
jgi:hypothetical protein